MKPLNNILFAALLVSSTDSYSVEITPLFGYRGGGEFTDTVTQENHTVVSSDIYGLIIGLPYEQGKQLELYYSHQSSDIRSVNITQPTLSGDVDVPLSIDYLHLGGTSPIADEKDYKTFVSGGLGFAYLSPDLSGLQSDLRASFSIGIGMKYHVTDNMALRLEARGMGTLFNSNATLFCNGGCSLTVNGSLFMQGEVFAGVAIEF